jgi:hypothetical protein
LVPIPDDNENLMPAIISRGGQQWPQNDGERPLATVHHKYIRHRLRRFEDKAAISPSLECFHQVLEVFDSATEAAATKKPTTKPFWSPLLSHGSRCPRRTGSRQWGSVLDRKNAMPAHFAPIRILKVQTTGDYLGVFCFSRARSDIGNITLSAANVCERLYHEISHYGIM